MTGTQINVSTLGKVPSASVADSATNATNAANATNATSATNATNATNANTIGGTPLNGITARAYGFINANATIDAAKSKNIASVTMVGGGSQFCAVPTASSGIDPTTEFPVVSADFQQGNGTFHVAEVNSQGCSGGWSVYTFSIANTGSTMFEPTAFSLIAP